MYTPFRSFRDDVDAIGLFLDTGGRDVYQWEMPDSSKTPDSLQTVPRSERGNDREWLSHRGPNSRGSGMDREEISR